MYIFPSIIIPSQQSLELIFEIFVIVMLLKLMKLIYCWFIRKGFNLEERYGKDSYVLITGATFGIGKGYATAFAELGFNLILVSRNESKLNDVKAELLNINSNIKIEILSNDFSKKNKLNNYEAAFNPLLRKFDISVLVNNVGISHEDYFYKLQDNNYIHDYIDVNIVSQTILTKLFMVEMNKRKNKSAIISMSSIAAEVPYPGNAIYSATKAYNDFLSRSLYGEYNYEKSNIDFLSVKPSYVESNMSQMSSDGFDVITVKQHVDAVLKDLGHEIETQGYYTHKIQGIVIMNCPEFMKRYFFADSKAKEERLQARHQNKNEKKTN